MTRIAEVALFTTDVPRLIEFYERLLGTSPRSRSESHAYFDVGDTTVFIHLATDEAPSGAPNGDHIAFALPDQDRLTDELRPQGHDVSGPKQIYWGRPADARGTAGRTIARVEAAGE